MERSDSSCKWKKKKDFQIFEIDIIVEGKITRSLMKKKKIKSK